MRIEDYGFISDLQTGALVGRDGSIDWLCLPRFDSDACFAALLGNPDNGRWLIAPAGEPVKVSRRYRGESLILETLFETRTGAVRLIDCMPPRGKFPDLVRIVEGVRGHVKMKLCLTIRFGYGQAVPWVRQRDGDLHAIAGPDELVLRTDVPLKGEDHSTSASFTVREGEQVPFVLTWYPSHLDVPKRVQAADALRDTERFWKKWASRNTDDGEWSDAVRRSLLVLKGLIYEPTGGIVAAATTSLPEKIGGARNWDYLFCWLRDASFTLRALVESGYLEEAEAWRDWLLRAVAGSAEQLQIMYGLSGERRLDEMELPWLPGYEDSRPVRIGNAAVKQFQLDVFGTVISTLHDADCAGLPPQPLALRLQAEFMRVGDAVARAGRGHLGSARKATPLRAFEAHGLARGGLCGEHLPAAWIPEGGAPLDPPAEPDPPRSLPRGLQRKARNLRAGLRLPAARRQRAADAPGRIPALFRPARAGNNPRDRKAAHDRRPRPPL